MITALTVIWASTCPPNLILFCTSLLDQTLSLLSFGILFPQSASKMASNTHEDDTMPEETAGYKLSQPKQSLAEYQQMGMCDHGLRDSMEKRC